MKCAVWSLHQLAFGVIPLCPCPSSPGMWCPDPPCRPAGRKWLFGSQSSPAEWSALTGCRGSTVWSALLSLRPLKMEISVSTVHCFHPSLHSAGTHTQDGYPFDQYTVIELVALYILMLFSVNLRAVNAQLQALTVMPHRLLLKMFTFLMELDALTWNQGWTNFTLSHYIFMIGICHSVNPHICIIIL